MWLSAESFKPVISKTFTHMVIGLPYFFDAEGCNQMHISEIDMKTSETPRSNTYQNNTISIFIDLNV